MTWNKAAIAALGPALTTILLTADTRMGWNLGAEFWGAVLTVAFGVLTFAVPNSAPAAATLKSAAWLAILLTAVVMLAGCASAPAPEGTPAPERESVIVKAAELKAGVVDFEMADLTEASRIAHNANDVLAYQCFDYLVTVVPKAQDNSNGKFDGPATAFMRTRLAVKRINEGPSDELKANCAALYLDAKDDVTGLAGKIAALAAKLGIKGFSPL